jgi:hypothetical protein
MTPSVSTCVIETERVHVRSLHSDVKLLLKNTFSTALANTSTPLIFTLRRRMSSLPHFQRSMDDMSVYPLYRTHTFLAKITKYAA